MNPNTLLERTRACPCEVCRMLTHSSRYNPQVLEFRPVVWPGPLTLAAFVKEV